MNIKKTIKIIIKSLMKDDLQVLIERGLKIGINCHFPSDIIIDPSHCNHICIGNNVTIAPNVHILAHDASTKMFLNYSKIRNVTIGSNVFIGAGTIVLPGSNIEDNVIIGAGSIVSGNLLSDSVYAGSPCRRVSSLNDYLNKQKSLMKDDNIFNANYTIENKTITQDMKLELYDACVKYGISFLE